MANPPLSPPALDAVLAFIPLFEDGVFKETSSVYVSTGEYAPHARELQKKLRELAIAPDGFDWMSWVQQARPYLQNPESISSANAEDVSRLVAMAVESERFNKSLFPHLCSSGVLHHLLLRLRSLSV